MLQVAKELRALQAKIEYNEVSYAYAHETLYNLINCKAVVKYPTIQQLLIRIIRIMESNDFSSRDVCIGIITTLNAIGVITGDMPVIPKEEENLIPVNINKLTGGSVSYYKLHISSPIHFEEYDCECGDIVEALNMTFNEGEAFKAIWRKAAARLGGGKKDSKALYDAEKIEYYGNRILKNATIDPTKNIFLKTD
jgi:hypothetical protein